jgi:hypothetical protein
MCLRYHCPFHLEVSYLWTSPPVDRLKIYLQSQYHLGCRRDAHMEFEARLRIVGARPMSFPTRRHVCIDRWRSEVVYIYVFAFERHLPKLITERTDPSFTFQQE